MNSTSLKSCVGAYNANACTLEQDGWGWYCSHAPVKQLRKTSVQALLITITLCNLLQPTEIWYAKPANHEAQGAQ